METARAAVARPPNALSLHRGPIHIIPRADFIAQGPPSPFVESCVVASRPVEDGVLCVYLRDLH